MINFRTAFIHDGELISDPYAVAREYLRLWFWLDFLSSIPFDWFFAELDFTTTAYIDPTIPFNASNGGSASDAVLMGFGRVFKIIKLVRLLRVVRLFRYVSRWEQSIIVVTQTTLRLAKLIVIL